MRSAVATGIGAYDGRVARLPACARLSTAGTTPRHALGRGLNRGLPGAVRTHRPPFDTPLGQVPKTVQRRIHARNCRLASPKKSPYLSNLAQLPPQRANP